MPIEPADVCQFLADTGWSQARFAWELGVNQPRISRFIKGFKKPNAELQAVLEAFFVSDHRARVIARGLEQRVCPTPLVDQRMRLTMV